MKSICLYTNLEYLTSILILKKPCNKFHVFSFSEFMATNFDSIYDITINNKQKAERFKIKIVRM